MGTNRNTRDACLQTDETDELSYAMKLSRSLKRRRIPWKASAIVDIINQYVDGELATLDEACLAVEELTGARCCRSTFWRHIKKMEAIAEAEALAFESQPRRGLFPSRIPTISASAADERQSDDDLISEHFSGSSSPARSLSQSPPILSAESSPSKSIEMEDDAATPSSPKPASNSDDSATGAEYQSSKGCRLVPISKLRQVSSTTSTSKNPPSALNPLVDTSQDPALISLRHASSSRTPVRAMISRSPTRAATVAVRPRLFTTDSTSNYDPRSTPPGPLGSSRISTSSTTSAAARNLPNLRTVSTLPAASKSSSVPLSSSSAALSTVAAYSKVFTSSSTSSVQSTAPSSSPFPVPSTLSTSSSISVSTPTSASTAATSTSVSTPTPTSTAATSTSTPTVVAPAVTALSTPAASSPAPSSVAASLKSLPPSAVSALSAGKVRFVPVSKIRVLPASSFRPATNSSQVRPRLPFKAYVMSASALQRITKAPLPGIIPAIRPVNSAVAKTQPKTSVATSETSATPVTSATPATSSTSEIAQKSTESLNDVSESQTDASLDTSVSEGPALEPENVVDVEAPPHEVQDSGSSPKATSEGESTTTSLAPQRTPPPVSAKTLATPRSLDRDPSSAHALPSSAPPVASTSSQPSPHIRSLQPSTSSLRSPTTNRFFRSSAQRTPGRRLFSEDVRQRTAAIRAAKTPPSNPTGRSGTSERTLWRPGDFKFFISKTLKRRSLIIYGENNTARIYRRGCERLSSYYFRCSTCDSLKRKNGFGILPNITFVNGRIEGDRFPRHNPACKPLSIAAAEALRIDREARLEIARGRQSPRAAWNSAYRKAAGLVSKAQLQQVPMLLPSWEVCRRRYMDSRRRTFASADEPFNIPDQYRVTLRSMIGSEPERWLLAESETEGIIVFATDGELALASQSSVIVSDSSFRRCPARFSRLVTLHAQVENETGREWFPFAFALMKTATRRSFGEVFSCIRSAWERLGVEVAFERFHTGFERPHSDAAADVFGEDVVRGCLYHSTMSFMNFLRTEHLTSSYKHCREIRTWIRKALSLPLLPPEVARSLWRTHLHDWPVEPEGWQGRKEMPSWPTFELQALATHVEKIWIERPNERWNHYKCYYRTTNIASLLHSQLSRQMLPDASLPFFLRRLQGCHSLIQNRIELVRNGNSVRRGDEPFEQCADQLRILTENLERDRALPKLSDDEIRKMTERYLLQCSDLLCNVLESRTRAEAGHFRTKMEMMIEAEIASDTDPEMAPRPKKRPRMCNSFEDEYVDVLNIFDEVETASQAIAIPDDA